MLDIKKVNDDLVGMSAQQIVNHFVTNYKGRVALSSSLGLEDQVLTDMVCRTEVPTRIFTLDTGRLFPETYSLMARTNTKYGIKLEVFFPNQQAVESMVNDLGVNLFYDSIDNRKQCCRVRKLEPLSRAFQGLDVWICGLRREQSITRADIDLVEWDATNGMLKVNPLIDWSEADCWAWVDANSVPTNPLHKKGFPSIGCQPCTRAIASGDDVRAGRWWWENPDQKECGLHKR